jgi:hypothetical protein
MLPTFPQTASAVSEDIGSMNALDALGIDTSLMPEGYDENSTDNPYGRNNVAVNPVYELFVTGVGERTESTALVEEIVYGDKTTTTTTVYRQNTLYGHNKALKQSMENFYTNQESLTEQEACQEIVTQTVYDADPTNPIETTVTIRPPIVATATASGNFIGEGAAGKTGQVVTVGAGSLDKNGGLYLYFTDPVTGDISGQVKTLLDTDKVIGNSGEKMDEDFAESPYLMQNYLQITAGDFDNNGIDEVAVYVAEQGKSRVEVYKLETTSSSGEDFYFTTSNWKKAWTYYFHEAPYVSNMVSLTSGDFNRDGTDDIALTWGYYYGDENNNACQAVVLYGSNTNMLQVTRDIDLSYNTANIVRAAFTFGDIDGDNVDDLILGGQLASDIAGKNLNTRFIAIYTYDGTNDRFIQSTAKNFDLFEKKDGNYVHAAMATRSIKDKYYSSPASTANIAAVNMNGVGKAAYIYLDSLLFEYGDEGLVIKMALDADPSFNKNINSTQNCYVEYGVVAADFTGDCKETLQVMQYYVPLVVTEYVTKYVYLWWWYYYYSTIVEVELPGDLDMLGVYGGDSSIQVERTGDVNFSTSFCRLNTDQDTALLKYTGEHYISYTDPEVLAVLASAPYFADLDNDELSGSYMESETSYTSSSGSGSGSSTSHTLNLGAYISFEQEFEVFGVKVGSIQAESAYNHGWTWETAKSSTLEQSISYATLAGSDAIAFYSIPMETYVYESLVPIIDEVTGEVTGYDTQYMSVNIPHTAAVKVLPLETYERIAADYSELPQVSGVILTHTVGDPSTYPSSTAGFKNAISYNGDWSGVNYGVGSITQEITMTSEVEKSYTNTNTVEAKIGAGPGNMVFGVSAGYEHGSSQVTVTTSGSSFTGQLFNMPTEAEQYHYNYSWKIFSYEYSGSGNSFPVVSYLVTDVTAPPKLPTDFQQDTVGTTDEKITLTWSYSGAAAGFQIYRYYVFPDGSGSYELAFIPASSAIGADTSGTRYYQYEDTGLYPYTEYDYQIQVVGASQPTDSILSPVYTAKTKIDVGYPDISLTGVAEGKLLVYPDTNSTVEVTINNSADYTETPRFQWQKLTGAGWTDIIGATSTEYTFRSAGLADEGQYRCRVNAIYNSYYISAYSEVFTLEYSKRTPTVVNDSFTVIDTTNENNDTVPKITISLTSAHSDHYYDPSGSVIFEVTGADYSRSFPVELSPSDSSGVADATITLDNPLPDGAYEITAYYSGSRVYKSLTTPSAIAYLSGSESGYVLTLNKSYIYGNTIVPSLKSVQKVEGITSTSPIVGEISYKVVQHSWEWDTEGVLQRNSTTITDFVSDVDGSVTAYQAGKFTLSASIGTEEVASKEFTVVQRTITIGIYDQEDEAGDLQLKHPDSSILKVDSGQLAYNESIVNLGLAVKATNSAGTVVDIVYTTDPGSYTIIGTAGATSGIKYDNYLISYVPGTYVLTGPKYSVVGVSQPLLGKTVGTLEMVSPEGNDNENWTTTYANGTTLVFMAKPNNGYSVKNWSITNDKKEVIATGTNNQYLSHLMKSEHITVAIAFEVAQRTLSYQAIEGGTVECTSNTVINSGDVVMSGAQFTFKATPIKGYHFVEWQLTEIGKSPTKPVGTPHADGSNSCQITMGDGNTVLYAIFARDSYTLTLQGELQASYWDDTDNDITTPDELVTTITGDSIKGDKVVTVTHKPGFSIPSDAVWKKGGVPASTGVSSDNQSYTFTMLEDTVISVETEVGYFDINLLIEGPGDTQNAVSVTVNGMPVDADNLSGIAGGSTLTFTAMPGYGYVFDKWVINDEITNDTTRNIAALGGNLTVRAVFKANTAYTVSVTHGERGSVAYTLNGGESKTIASGGVIPVFAGDQVVITATPQVNFMVENWWINGALEQTMVKTQTFHDIAADLNVEVVFGAQTYSSVRYVAGDNGTIVSATSDGVNFESGSNSVGNGTRIEFTAVPNNGFMVDKWLLNEEVVKNDYGQPLVDPTFCINALSGDSLVEVTFREIITHIVQVENINTTTTVEFVPASAFVTGEVYKEVHYGATAIFAITPDSGYRITSVSVTGNAGSGLNGFDSIMKQADGKWICVVGAVTADLSVTTEAKQLYSITVPTIPVGGSITVSADEAIEGEEITLMAIPASGYKFSGWTVTGGGVTLSDTSTTPATFTMPNCAVAVAATFTYINYGGGGGFAIPESGTSKAIYATSGGSIQYGDVTVIVPPGVLPANATFSIKKLDVNETNSLVSDNLRLKIGSDVFEITTTGSTDFGDKTIAIKIAYDPDAIAENEQPVINYYDEVARQWVAIETITEYDKVTGTYYTVTTVNHLTKFAVFSTVVNKKTIILTIGQMIATVEGVPYTLDAAPVIDISASRTLVPVRFVSEVLGADVEWIKESNQVKIADGSREIILTIGSTSVIIDGNRSTIDSAPIVIAPGRTFVPVRFISETLGADVYYNEKTKQIVITR